jgi:hypothetical protein
LSYSFNNNPNGVKTTNNKFYDMTPNLRDALNEKYPNEEADYIDPTINYILSSGNDGSDKVLINNVLQPNSYIGFANYAFASFPKKDLDDSNNIVYESMPVFTGVYSKDGIPAVFPVSLLYDHDDVADDSLPTHNSQEMDLDL